MRELAPQLQEQLGQMFGRFVTFDPFERRFYRSDVGVMPSLVSPLIGNLMPAGVVKPLSEEKVVELVRFARQHGIPLVPRGKASSGYGGVLPVQGGLVVDLSWLTHIESIDAEGMTATVGAGVVWETLEKELNKHGLALCTYPSSAPSSTVGGWLAQGGMGYGAFAYGPFRNTVVSARVVLPTGEVRTFAGEELDLISDAEGITGFITAVTLRVRKWEPEAVWAARFSSAHEMARAVQAVQKEKLPLWSVSFITPQMAEMKNNLPPKIEHGHVVEEERPKLPAGYILVMVADESARPALEGRLVELVRAAGGELLDEALAHHEWAERFNIMHVKRLGPSLVPAEVLVPVEKLGSMLAGVEERIKLPMAIEGMVSGTGEVTLLGFILHDQRKFTFNFAYALSLSMLKLAKENGGRAYSTGLYFAKEAPNVLGAGRLEKLRSFKQQVDPQNLFNPKKVLDGKPLLSTFMNLAETFEPLIRPFGNAAKNPIGERIAGAGRRGIPDDVAWYAYACAQCGYCVDQCDQYYGREWESQSPRGKWKFLREYMEGKVDWNRKMDEAVLACTTCEMCNVRCPLELPIEPSWLKLRGRLVHEEGHMTFPPFEVMRASLRKEYNIWGSFRQKRSAWYPKELGPWPEKAEVAYFPGCTASYVEQDIAQGAVYLLQRAGVEFTYLGEDEACCGIPMLVAGLWDTWEEIMRHNINAMKARGVKTVVTSCPACWLSWHTFYPQWAEKLGIEYDIEAKHYSQVIAEKLAAGEFCFEQPVPARTVTWHDSCHMGRAGGIYEEPRQVLRAIPGITFVEMEHNREHGHCCGSVLSLVADPVVAARIGDVRLREAVDAGAEAVVASCPCCEVQLRVTNEKRGHNLEIIDLAHLACESLGIPLPDPKPYMLEQWATFEAMINLLKPQAMAEFMEGMFPEMIEAMPGMFRGMMHFIQRAPAPVKDAMLAVMKPMMPALFPILLPGMMPKVMPTMLEKVGQVVPMSEDMQELMPDLLPAAMNNLMSKMLPELMPYLVPKLVNYLRRPA